MVERQTLVVGCIPAFTTASILRLGPAATTLHQVYHRAHWFTRRCNGSDALHQRPPVGNAFTSAPRFRRLTPRWRLPTVPFSVAVAVVWFAQFTPPTASWDYNTDVLLRHYLRAQRRLPYAARYITHYLRGSGFAVGSVVSVCVCTLWRCWFGRRAGPLHTFCRCT